MYRHELRLDRKMNVIPTELKVNEFDSNYLDSMEG